MINDPKGTLIYQTDGIICQKNTLVYTVSSMCEDHLFSYEGYRKAVTKKLKITYLIPIFLSDDLQLMPVKRFRDYDNIFINYAAITSYREDNDNIEIEFNSGTKIYIKMSLYSFNQQITKLKKIRNTKVKHFHRLNDSKCL